MNFDEIEQQNANIEDRLENLKQEVTFLYQDYTYHHKNNEGEILKRKDHCLCKANSDLKSLIEAYKELMCKLECAKKKRDEAKELLRRIKAHEAISENDDEKENENSN